MSKAIEEPKVVFVVVHTPGPDWKAGVEFRNQVGVRDHVAHYRKWHMDGKLSLGGPFLDGSGGMMVSEPGLSLEEVVAFAAADPSVKNGLIKYEVKPWMIGMEKK